MANSSRDRFVRIALLLTPVALVAAVMASPPDPFTLVRYAVPLLALVLLTAYLLAYRDGLETLESN
ncbi:hypothetical protein [Natronobacterium texcoconense]|nr:hypothetical protein [Natronobacterium texcoconense]